MLVCCSGYRLPKAGWVVLCVSFEYPCTSLRVCVICAFGRSP